MRRFYPKLIVSRVSSMNSRHAGHSRRATGQIVEHAINCRDLIDHLLSILRADTLPDGKSREEGYDGESQHTADGWRCRGETIK